VHGSRLSSTQWAPQVPLLRDHVGLTLVDLPGHGARAGEVFTMDRCVEVIGDAVGSAAAHGEPVVLVGHSLGGFLSVLAAAKRPALARGVLMLDSPIIGGLLSPTIQFAKFTGWGLRFSPANISRRRRQHWPTREAAHQHFAEKASFARWDPRVLEDYIASGIVPSEDPEHRGVTLAFDREVETRIYSTLASDIPGFLRRHPLQCPVAFIGGTQSTEVRQVGMAATERLTEGRISWIEGGHLFPFERPEDTSAEVLRCLSALAREPALA